MEVSGGWGALRGYRVLRTFRRALVTLECAHGCCHEVGSTLICRQSQACLQPVGVLALFCQAWWKEQLTPIYAGDIASKQEKPTPQKSHDMACAKLGWMGGWKGLALQLTFTGGRHTVAVCIRRTCSGKDCFPCFFQCLFLINNRVSPDGF